MDDFNQDGHLDLAFMQQNGASLRLWNANRQVFDKPQQLLSLKDGCGLATGDVNGDGLPDLFVVQGGGPGFSLGTNENDALLLNQGDGNFQTFWGPPTPGIGDGVVAVRNHRTQRDGFYVGNGYETVSGPFQFFGF
jgi:hypothetical protein